MKTRKLMTVLFLLVVCQVIYVQNEKYRDTALSVEERAEDLVGRMTLDEKIGQMMNNAPGIYKGLTYWSPNINIFRDPRWGRGQDTYGDDPRYLKASACSRSLFRQQDPESLWTNG